MARFRLSRPAQSDLAQVLARSEERWGQAARRRYAKLLVAAMTRIAGEPEGPATRDRSDLLPGMRSLHLRNTLRERRASSVKQPVHVIYYRARQPGEVEIVRVLHERMEPSRHLRSSPGVGQEDGES